VPSYLHESHHAGKKRKKKKKKKKKRTQTVVKTPFHAYFKQVPGAARIRIYVAPRLSTRC